MHHRTVFSLFIATVLAVCFGFQAVSAAAPPRNVVAAFLGNADRQFETDEQRKEIQRALTDMLQRPVGELRRKRYTDYQGSPNVWTLPHLLQRYFVPDRPAVLDERRFYRDLKAPAARAAVRKQLRAIARAAEGKPN